MPDLLLLKQLYNGPEERCQGCRGSPQRALARTTAILGCWLWAIRVFKWSSLRRQLEDSEGNQSKARVWKTNPSQRAERGNRRVIL